MRTGAMLLLLTVSMSMALVMIEVRGSIDQRALEIRESVGTAIQVRPAGSSQGAGQTLTSADVQALGELDHVLAVEKVLEARYSGEVLEPAINLSRFGGDAAPEPGVFGGGGANFARSIPISFNGVSVTEGTPLFEAGETVLTAGRAFTPDDVAASVVILGEALAEQNGYPVGSVLQLEIGPPLEVVGTFSAGNPFQDNALFMPLGVLQQLMGAGDGFSSATVYVDSVDNLQVVTDEITSTLGADRVDTTSGLDQLDRLTAPLEGLRSTSSVGTVAALGGAGGVILLAMFVLVRERGREIGVLKAIGGSSRQIVTQFAAEALVVSLVAAFLGFGVAVASAETVGSEFFDPTTQSQSGGFGDFARFRPEGAGGGGQGGAGERPAGDRAGFGGFFGSRFGGGSLGPLDISVSPDLLFFATGGAVALSMMGTVLASAYVARLRPADVLRNE